MSTCPKILVTGASRGIGEAISKKFAKKGYEVLLVARTQTSLERVQKEIQAQGGKASYYVCDISNPQDLDFVLDKILLEHGHIPNLILNAGVSTNSSFLDNLIEDIKLEMEINYFSILKVIKKFLPEMIRQKYGNIVTIGSVMSLLPFPANSTYAATKAALFSFTRSLRLEVEKYNVNVSIVLPGLTKTDMTKDFHSLFLPFDTPEDVANSVEEAILHKKEVVITGLLNQTAVNIYNFLPNLSNFVIGKLVDGLVPFIKNKT
jgi:short-subunit dehydrogenase